jgi:NitT/TauT family transport system substrate-binding protein
MRAERAVLMVLTCAMSFLVVPAAIANDKVTFGTASRVGLANTVMYAAEALGLFREEGIDLETVQFEGSGVLYPQIANNTITIGYPIPDILIISHDTGKDPLPVKFFYDVTRKYNWEIIVPEASDIKSLKDLKGKTIGVGGLSWGNVPVTRAMLKDEGLNTDTDISIVAVGQGASAVDAFKRGKIDALNEFDVVHSQIEASGFKIRRLPMPEKYSELSGNSFAASTATLEKNPDLLVRFGRAYSKGLVVCEANPEGCIRLFWKMHPDAKPAGDEAAAMKEAVVIMVNNLNLKLPDGSLAARRYGEFGKAGWETNVQVLYQVGTVHNPDIKVDDLYTNDLVPKFSDFDPKPLIERAKSLQ